MEATFVCIDGQQLCSRWMLGHSEFFWEKMAKMDEFGNSLKFDYSTDFSLASVKFFLDCLHLIPAGPVDVATLVEVVAFCQFEGKTTYDSFEVDLVDRIMTSLMKMALPIGTELLISAYLAKIDNFDNRFEQTLVEKHTEESVSSLLFKFNPNTELNKRLIAMCAQKAVFVDVSEDTVLATLMVYGKNLVKFGSTDRVVENFGIEHDFRPNPRSARYLSTAWATLNVRFLTRNN